MSETLAVSKVDYLVNVVMQQFIYFSCMHYFLLLNFVMNTIKLFPILQPWNLSWPSLRNFEFSDWLCTIDNISVTIATFIFSLITLNYNNIVFLSISSSYLNLKYGSVITPMKLLHATACVPAHKSRKYKSMVAGAWSSACSGRWFTGPADSQIMWYFKISIQLAFLGDL